MSEDMATKEVDYTPSPCLSEATQSSEVVIDEQKLMRKIDWHIVPWLSLLYLLSILDRGSIGNARLYHMQTDIHITDKQYLIALAVFYFPCALLELPSNLAFKWLRPSRWLSLIMFIWGIVMTMQGLTRNYGDLVALRVLLGVAEAGVYPGVIFYMSCWYKRSELGTRFAVFVAASTVAGAFSGLLAAAISNMNGIGGKPGWAWIFILEGLVTISCAVASFFIIDDFPDGAKFLNQAERAWVIHRLQEDLQFSAAGEKFQMKYIRQCLTDKKTWVAMGMFMGLSGPLQAFLFFTPSIINQFGFQATPANLLSVPIYVWACIITVIIGYIGDRTGHRGYINLGCLTLGLAGYIILVMSRNPVLSYFAVYLAASGLYPCIPNTSAWVSANTEGSYKRSATIGMMVGCGNLNGAITSNVYRARDAPWYRSGHSIILAYIVIAWMSSLTFLITLRRENARREAGLRDEVIEGAESGSANEKNGRFESVDEAKRAKGDQWSGFRYTL